MKPMHYALTLSAALAVAGLALSAHPAAAANSAMAECNKEWNAATASNSTNGATYQDFLKGCLKKNSSAATTTTTAASTTATAAAPAADTAPDAAAKKACNAQWKALTDAGTQGTQKKKEFVAACLAKAGGAAAPAAADAAPAAPAAKTMAAASGASAADKKACNAQWKALTDAGTQGTQKKKEYIAACLEKMGTGGGTAAAAPAATPPAAPATPAATTTKAASTTPPAATTAPAAAAPVAPPEPTTDTAAKTPATTDANGKPKTAGQLAMDARIHECGIEWKKAKADGTTNGLKWPQYWSACNKRLKAAGN